MPNKISSWLSAARLRTLPLALSAIVSGGAIAYRLKAFDSAIFIWACVCTVFLQVLSNFANDYGDSQHGADSEERIGPKRQIQQGLLTKREMMVGIVVMVLCSLASGLYLIYLAFPEDFVMALVFLVVGLGAIAAAIKYTMGKSPYGYAGLGDFFVLLFFGFVGVGGTCFLFVKSVPVEALALSWSMGCFSVGVLNLNNMRDIKSDEMAGKRSIPVRIGLRSAKIYHSLLIGTAVLMLAYAKVPTWYFNLWFLALPLFVFHLRLVWLRTEPAQLDPLLKQLALSTLASSLLVFASQVLA